MNARTSSFGNAPRALIDYLAVCLNFSLPTALEHMDVSFGAARMDAMAIAFDEARFAAARGEVPVGAVVLGPGRVVLGRAGNRVEADCDPTAHAELLALRAAAAAIGSPRLAGCDLFVTLEPCPMCAQAISFFRVRRLVFGAYDPKGGGVEHGARIFDASSCHHRPEIIGGVRETDAAALLRAFFTGLRSDANR